MDRNRSARHLPVLALLPGLVLAGLVARAPASAAPPAFTLFESGQVRPLALAPNGATLYAVNTPDNRLEIFTVKRGTLTHEGSVAVGLEPVAVAARSNQEVWVVNHLSDSVSVVDVSHPKKARVVRTLLVGDEPRDIVFAGPGKRRAFITTAHRGQNSPVDPALITPGVGRADVWVFAAASQSPAPLTIVTLFSDTPRALAATPDGRRVYAAAFLSGNRTTVVETNIVNFSPLGLPPPTTNTAGDTQPSAPLIVKFDGQHWVDELRRSWDDQVNFALPDKDVFVLDAMANPPAPVAGHTGAFAGVGTVLYNMAVNPVSGRVYVSNTEAFNAQRFEGPGVFAGHSVRGRFAQNRITVINPATGRVAPRHLNKHIDFNTCCAPIPNAENQKSLALPQGMSISANGQTLYVAALGSDKIGVFSTAALEADTFVPSLAHQIPVSGGGPTGMVLDEARDQLYVLTRFDNAISIIDVDSKAEVAHVPMYNPEPASVVHGRRFLYDASFTSSHGDSACASCHVFGDPDGLAWDLGDPDAVSFPMPGPFVLDPTIFGQAAAFAALKGPMTTQSRRVMANHGPMHWRGDRTGGNDAPSAQPDSGTFDEEAAFTKFQFIFQSFKVAHLRNTYTKVGMFGMVQNLRFNKQDHDFIGDQIRGFGVAHDGAVDTVFRFHDQVGFNEVPGIPGFPEGDAGVEGRRQVTSFIHAFDTNLAPIVGQQVTRADADECDLVVKSRVGKHEVGFLYQGDGTFRQHRVGQPAISAAALRQVATARHALTYTCAPPGAGVGKYHIPVA
jgi:YVTN family beta-propeller protein